ncbi:hypothetical protein M0L20_14800 [Spirosoma sp. RP8]|uniref:DUF7619 domain-containing protein n=1 Tax=Spirosoma liriopis TaxID=2937440 RepID=A0ABT0HLT4_9BACT|nr:hypothetical protein [Spirosoma liriopis]MCK8493136.1 hypothetical protein [Spirosoma liriopis]
MIKLLRCFGLILACFTLGFSASAQTLIAPKLVTDGPVTKMEYSPSLGLIMAGSFRYVGYPAKNVAIVDNIEANPSGRFPFLNVTNNVLGREIVPDGKGGWYIVSNSQLYSTGSFSRRPQQIWSDSTGRTRVFDCITHLNADNSIDTLFKINANTSTYRIINTQRVVLYKSRLYAWCDLADQSGSLYRRQLLGLNAQTGAVEWNSQSGHRLDVVTGYLAVMGRQLFVAGRMNVVNGQPATRYTLAYNLDTHQLTNWNPLSSADLECNNCEVSSLEGKANRLVMTVISSPTVRKEFIATDTVSAIIWRKQLTGYFHMNYGLTIDQSVGYYFAGESFNSNIVKIRLSDGQTMKQYPYPAQASTIDTSQLYVGTIKGLSLQGKHLYLYGSVTDGTSVRRSVVQVDTATFNATNWKPFNERESGESESTGSYRTIEALSFQGNRVCMAGDFNLLKLNYAPNLVAVNPLTNTVRWRPRVNLFQEGYLQSIGAIAADGDSLIWIYQDNMTMKALDARTGFRVKRFDLNSPGSGLYPIIKQIIPAADRLYIQGQFPQIRGIAVTNGFAAITKEGGVFPWEPVFSSNTGGQVNKMVVQGDRIYLGGRFTATNGSRNLAIINRFTGDLLNWKSTVSTSPDDYEVKDFLIQGGELLTVRQDRGYDTPGEYRKVSLTTGMVTASYSYTTCQAADQIIAKDKYVFINEKYCKPYTRDNVSYFDQGSKKFSNRPLLPRYTIQNSDGYNRDYIPNPFNMVFVGNKLYYGSNFDDDYYGTVLPVPRLMSVSFPKGFFAETVDYFPKSGGNGGDVTLNFYGNSLAVGSKVKLTRTGQIPIVGIDSLTKYPEAFRIEVTFDLRGKTVGQWNIEVTTPSGESYVINNGFIIEKSKSADIQVMLNAPAAFRPGASTKFNITIVNTGDIDAHGIPVWLAIPNGIKFTPGIAILDREGKLDSLSPFPVDSLFGKPFGGKLYCIFIPEIKAREVFEFPFRAVIETNNVIQIHCWGGIPIYGSPIRKSLVECIYKTAFVAADILFGLKNLRDGTQALYDCGVGGMRALYDPFLFIKEDRKFAGDLMRGLYGTAFHCGEALYNFAQVLPQGRWTKVLEFAGGAGVVHDAVEAAQACKDAYDDLGQKPSDFFPNPKKHSPSGLITPVFSRDPNDKLGLPGSGIKRYVNGKEAFSYLIRFENYASATASAQIIRIVDTLDRAIYDYNTYQLGFFNIADTTFYAPPGRKQYSVDWDLRPAKNLVLRMEARFNDTTGILTSTYTALDPLTMELTEDVLAGFLPPNQNPPKGEGGLAFSIRLKDSLPNKTSISNTAHIYFDYNAPIPTPVWTNTIDKGLPESSMKPLATTSRSTTLTLGWHGKDVESGPNLYDVFVSVNGGNYKALLTATRDTSFRFVGKADSTYRFYSVAYDSVYNQEIIPLSFDTETTIRLNTAVIQSLRSGNWNDPTTWSCGCIPAESDDVVIQMPHTVKLDSTMPEAVCRSLDLLGNFSMQGSSILINGTRIVIDSDNVLTK